MTSTFIVVAIVLLVVGLWAFRDKTPKAPTKPTLWEPPTTPVDEPGCIDCGTSGPNIPPSDEPVADVVVVTESTIPTPLPVLNIAPSTPAATKPKAPVVKNTPAKTAPKKTAPKKTSNAHKRKKNTNR